MSTAHKVRREELRKRLAASPAMQNARAFFASPAGAEFARWLDREFVRGDIQGESDRDMLFNLGAREFALRLLEVRDFTKGQGDDQG